MLFRKQPRGRLTKKQEAIARKWAGRIYKKEVAKKVGTSWANLGRWGRDNGVSFNAHKYPESTVRSVLSFYEKHGRRKTQKKFPNVSVRSIVERHYGEFSPRQIPWTADQIHEAVKMAGLVSHISQAKFFKRPGANVGSIKSLWVKRFNMGSGCINGMTHCKARHFVTSNARYLRAFGVSRTGKLVQFRKLILWIDMESCLKPDCPKYVREAVRAMADFQRWLWNTQNPKPKILKMIQQRECKI